MIIKKLTVPLIIQQNEALLGRLRSNHPKIPEIKDDLGKKLAGYRGEKSMEYYLSFLPKPYKILHTVRLLDEQYYFQMDIILLSPRGILIVEVKNLSGTVILGNPYDQLIQVNNDKEKGYSDPVNQVKHQKFQLQRWLARHRLQNIPIDYLVVFSNPSTIIKSYSNNIESLKKVCRSNQFITKINEFEKTRGRYPIDEKTIKRIGKLLLKHHKEAEIDILERYGIHQNELIRGVLCKNCSLRLTRNFGKWHCEACQSNSIDAHVRAIHDYFLLIDYSITNKAARDFLQLSSRNTTKQLLQGMNLKKTGTKKGTVYHWG
ncbi:nuclease-related domain-containing protein [Bacillus sp. AK031]